MNKIQNFVNDLRNKPFIKSLINNLRADVYVVGGATRDLILNKPNKDIDLIVRNIPIDNLINHIEKFGRVDVVGKSFGVLKFIDNDGVDFDIALPRKEKPNGEGGYRGFEVQSDENLPIEDDLLRRDAKFNAMAININTGKFIDPLGGLEDIEKKQISAANPEAFSDDPLRMLRIISFASRFGFTIEPETMQMIKENASKIKEIAPERILIELDKIVTKGNALIGVQLLSDTGLFKQIFGNEIKPSQIGRRDFTGVRTMAELLFLMMNGVVQNPAEFYLTRFSTEDAKRDKIYKELQALNLAFNSDLVDQQMSPVKARSIAHNMFTIAPQTLESKILPEQIERAAQELLQGKYPKTVNELQVNGNDLMQKGLQGKAIGDMLKSMLIRIYGDKIRNSKEELLSLVTKKNNEIQEDYEFRQKPRTWNINGKEVTINFFVKEYDKWNNKNGSPSYRDASKESVLEFLQNNYEDESTDKILNRELYWKLTDRDLLGEEVDRTEKVEYGALMLFLDVPVWKKITSVIKKDDIYEIDDEFGIETEPHVTILYGFHGNVDAKQIFNLYKKNFDLKPIEIGVKGISIFENEEFDVVKMDVESKILTKMNSVMRELPNTNKYPEYHAHITLAYVKKGTGEKYVKKFEKNRILVGNELVFSTKKEKKSKLKLDEKGMLKEEVKKNVLNEMSLHSISSDNIITPEYIQDIKGSDNYERYVEEYMYEEGKTDLDNEEVEMSEDFQNWFKYELQYRYENVVEKLENIIKSDRTIDIWRMMTVDENWLKQLPQSGKHLGIYWSWEENAAEAHWGHSGGRNIVVLIKSSVREEYVNWHDTIMLNMDISLGEEEKEIRLFKNTKLRIEELYINGENIIDMPENNVLKNKIFLAEEAKQVSYSSVVLDDKSRASLLKVFKPMIPEGWTTIAHHMTIKLGALEDGSREKQDMVEGTEITLTVKDYAMDELVMAVGVEGYPTTNDKPHITIAVNYADGGKPYLSNKLTDWKPLGFPIKLTGKVTEL